MAQPIPQLLALATLVLGMASMLAPARTASAAGPALAVAPSTASAVVGADVAVDITVADVPASPGLGGYVIWLKWDPAVLSLTSFTDSGWIESSDNLIVWCTPTTIDNATGKASADCTPLLGFGGLSTTAPQALVHAVFQAKATGTTSIDLAGSYLLNPSAMQIAPALANGTVNVTAPTATPVPATATAAATGTAAPSATTTPSQRPTSTSAPGAAPTSNVEAGSTNTSGGTLSNVEAPQAGSGDATGGASRTAWWVAGIAATAAALAGGAAVYGWKRGPSRLRNRRGRN